MDFLHIRIYLLLALLSLTMVAHQVNAQGLNSVMQNTAALIGDTSTSLTCGAETGLPSYVTWAECISTPAPDCVAVGYDDQLLAVYSGQYRLVATGNTGEFKLEIQSLAAAEAGQYKCWAAAVSTSESYAEVIALATAPSCTWNTTAGGNQAVEGDFLQMTCQVSYTGRWAPVTRWNEGLTASNETVTGLAKYSVIVEVGRVLPTYLATTSFDKPTDTGAGEADNAPDYQHTHTYPTLSVDYGPSVPMFSPQGDYYPDEKVTCTAVGKPPPTFRWIDLNTTATVASVPVLVIQEEWLGGPHRFQCEASVTDFRGQIHTRTVDNEFQVVPLPTTTTIATTTPVVAATTTPGTGGTTAAADLTEPGVNAAAIAGGVIGGVVVLVVIIVVICCCIRKKQRTKEEQANASRPPKPAVVHSDKVRAPDVIVNPNNYDMADSVPAPFPEEKVGYDPYSAPYSNSTGRYSPEQDPRDLNQENLTYADLALEDVPRSRKPIQMYEPTQYAEIRPQVPPRN